MDILVTGGAGFIATHTCVELIAAGYNPILIDNLSNSKAEAVKRVESLAGRELTFYRDDVRDRRALDAIFKKHNIEAVIHFAGLKAVGESVAKPLLYYDNNIGGTVALCEAMETAGVKRLVFSSSATVYGDPESVPIPESAPTGGTTNPYGRSKHVIEGILRDLHASDPSWRISLLRYFNPVGAHPSGNIGEDPNGTPNNLMPFIAQVAAGKRPQLQVFGGDYDTPDGTGIRDYIHVVDLALGHVAALRHIEKADGVHTVNLGTGRGHSVLEVVEAFKQASGRDIPYEIVDRRRGDIAACYADPTLAQTIFNWKATRTLAQMCEDAWRWQSANPNGYAT